MSRFAGKAVVATGAGQGIGRAYAHTVADLDGAKDRAGADEVQGAMAVELDVSDRPSAGAMAEAVLGAHGRIDVLVNNAAIFSTLRMKPFEEIEAEEFDRVTAVNARGVLNCCQDVVPAMRRQGAGKIVNIASSVVLTGRPFYAHHVASKGAVVALTRALASELGKVGINVNAVSLHGIVTEIPRETIREDQWAAIVAAQALKRKGSVEDTIGTTLFLASFDGDDMTGQTLNLDVALRFS